MELGFENNFPKDIMQFLINVGHNTTFYDASFGGLVSAISNIKGNITASADPRRQGRSAGF